MSQVVLHAKDNESIEQQINTLTLSLKSIVGREKTAFDKVNKLYDEAKDKQDVTLAYINRLYYILDNLYYVAYKLIQIQELIYLHRNKINDFNNIVADNGYNPCGQGCDKSYGCGASFQCSEAYGCDAGYCSGCDANYCSPCVGSYCTRSHEACHRDR